MEVVTGTTKVQEAKAVQEKTYHQTTQCLIEVTVTTMTQRRQYQMEDDGSNGKNSTGNNLSSDDSISDGSNNYQDDP